MSVKIVSVNQENMDKWLINNGYGGTYGTPRLNHVSVYNALDPTSSDYKVPEFIESIINEHESDGFEFVQVFDSGIIFRDMKELPNAMRKIISEEDKKNGKEQRTTLESCL